MVRSAVGAGRTVGLFDDEYRTPLHAADAARGLVDLLLAAEARPVKAGSDSSPLVTTEWLAAHLNDHSVRVVDVRWRSRYENGRGISFDDHDGYLGGHIPGAVFAGMVADLSDPEHPISDMLVAPDSAGNCPSVATTSWSSTTASAFVGTEARYWPGHGVCENSR